MSYRSLLVPGVCLPLICALASCAGAKPGPPPDLGPRDAFGGLTTNAFEPGARFRVEREGARWWFVTPEGGRFLSFGVNHVTWNGNHAKGTDRNPYNEAVTARYGTEEKWAEATSARLEQWGFNTVGAWSSTIDTKTHLPYAPILHLSQSFWSPWWKDEGVVPDFFSDAFLAYVEEKAAGIDKYAGDPKVLGYFIDNELPWAPDHRKTPELFYGYVALPADAAGKGQLVAFMEERYGTVEAFNEVWKPAVAGWDVLAATTALKPRSKKKAKADREAFTRLVARQYFKVTSEAIREKDPGALVLGCRFIPYNVPEVVVEACGEYCDVVSTNYYRPLLLGKLYIKHAWRGKSTVDIVPLDESLRAFHELTGKPVMVTEFTSRLKAEGYNSYPPP
ncbi:MAG: beta-galactosidase, partial [Candidatus Hydrogenedentes bacterium]|nr:beta-galactosidase [Candidatus Hydrogenedentota bacterium]